MATSSPSPPLPSPDPPRIADHPALDLLNTVIRQDDALLDLWATDADILRWLEAAHLLQSPIPGNVAPGALLRAAHRLRAAVRQAVEARSAGRPPAVASLNSFLALGRHTLQLHPTPSGALDLRRQLTAPMPEQLLLPLAESVAELLASEDPQHLRRCEGKGCVLWFLDRSPSQRRRWCSMEICGNRAKVAAFRARRPPNA